MPRGHRFRTSIPGVSRLANDHHLIIWPSVYTGMKPREHGMTIAFGQDTTPIQGRCVWDVLDKAGVPTGVFGSLLSFPPRNAGCGALLRVPESLADDPDRASRTRRDRCRSSRSSPSRNSQREALPATHVRGCMRLLFGSMQERRAARHRAAHAAADAARAAFSGDAHVPERA